MKPAATLSLQLSQTGVARLAALFGEGVGVETDTGIPLMTFLCDRLGIDRDYIDQRVQTIFVNGRAVDRVEQVHIGPGDVIALSAAMPGLAGATLRKGGLLAGFRKDISHSEGVAPSKTHQKTLVTLKLFNLVAVELAHQLLRKGVWVNGKRMGHFFQQADDAKLSDAAAIVWNGRPVPADRMTQADWPDDWIHLRVDTVTG
jgi:hypothetical protein